MDKNQEGGKKFDFGKLRYDLLPSRPISDTVAVLTFGATKYGDRNWELGMNWSRPYAAIHRHLSAWWMGQDLDEETGLSHLAHAACEILFLQEYEKTKAGRKFDDRPSSPKPRTRKPTSKPSDLGNMGHNLDKASTLSTPVGETNESKAISSSHHQSPPKPLYPDLWSTKDRKD